MPVPAVGKIQDRATFRALRRPAGRAKHGPVRVGFVPVAPGTSRLFPQVGYAIGRRCGNAVTRNRLRRRLRAAVADLAPELPTGAYLVTCEPDATALGYGDLAEALGRAMRAAATATGGPR